MLSFCNTHQLPVLAGCFAAVLQKLAHEIFIVHISAQFRNIRHFHHCCGKIILCPCKACRYAVMMKAGSEAFFEGYPHGIALDEKQSVQLLLIQSYLGLRIDNVAYLKELCVVIPCFLLLKLPELLFIAAAARPVSLAEAHAGTVNSRAYKGVYTGIPEILLVLYQRA